jgi:hypothetical protein
LRAVAEGRSVGTLDPLVTRKSIQTNGPVVSCDVCGRTLLRGEHADVFLHGGSRRQVCELCTARAVHEGWIREGLDDATVRSRQDGRRRGSLLQRLRALRPEPRPQPQPQPQPQQRPARRRGAPVEHDEPAWDEAAWDEQQRYAGGVEHVHGGDDHGYVDDGAADVHEQDAGQGYAEPQPEPQPELEAQQEWAPPPPPRRAPAAPAREQHQREQHQPRDQHQPREQRSVHAVPTNADLKMARALDLFNASSHRRTVSGVARSLGAPVVNVRPSPTEGSVVTIVVAWELSWYRFEVDLADEAAGVRVAGQGAELHELEPEEQEANAAADDGGGLHLTARHA